MINRLENIKKRYDEINELLSSEEITSNIKKLTELSKEQATLRDAVDCFEEYKKIIIQIKETEELGKDPEFKELAEIELITAKRKKKEKLEDKTRITFITVDPNDRKKRNITK